MSSFLCSDSQASRNFIISAVLALPSIMSRRMFRDLSRVSIKPLLVLFITWGGSGALGLVGLQGYARHTVVPTPWLWWAGVWW